MMVCVFFVFAGAAFGVAVRLSFEVPCPTAWMAMAAGGILEVATVADGGVCHLAYVLQSFQLA